MEAAGILNSTFRDDGALDVSGYYEEAPAPPS